MVKSCFGVVFGAVILNIISVGALLVAAADRSPATLLCVRNASASRGYGFQEKMYQSVRNLLRAHFRYSLKL